MKFTNSQNKSQGGDQSGPRYWKSLDDLAETPAFQTWLHREFPAGASEITGVNRRHFMKVMAASFGLAGLGMTGCRRPETHILPYARQPEHVIPGVASYFSTSMPAGAENIPLIVETQESRPTKIEGNPSYRPNGGATDIFAQASILDLYDPDRATHSKRAGKKNTKAAIKDLLNDLHSEIYSSKGKGFAVLSEKTSSPTRQRLIKELQTANPDLLWAEYEPTSSDNAEIAAEKMFGKKVRANYRYDNAKRIVSFDCDFLKSEVGSISATRSFSKGRNITSGKDASKMSRLYAVEAQLSVTGGMADHRLRLSAAHVLPFLRLFAAELFEQAHVFGGIASTLKNIGGSLDFDKKWIVECVKDLLANKGKSVVVAGSHHSVEVHQLVIAINDVLQATGRTVEYLELPEHKAAGIKDVAKALTNKEVKTLIILGGNPVYNCPGDLNWAEVQKYAGKVIRYGYYEDETSNSADQFIAATHYLESWSDGRAFNGTYVPVQPMIEPLFEGFSAIEILNALTGKVESDAYSEVRKTFKTIVKAYDQDKAFSTFLAEGLAERTEFNKVHPEVVEDTLATFTKTLKNEIVGVSSSSIEVLLPASLQVGDGRYNNNGWLQECPDPMTKLTWDNAILVSPRLAHELEEKFGVSIFGPKTRMNDLDEGLLQGAGKFNLKPYEAEFDRGREMAPLAKLTINGKEVKGPIHVQPGLANYTVVAPLGFGRKVVGRVGEGTGFDAYPLMTAENPAFTNGVSIDVLDERYKLANTQEHWSMEGRAIIRESNVEKYEEDNGFVDKMGMESHSPPVYGADKDKSLQDKAVLTPRGMSAYEFPDFGGDHQWGMSIDLNTCTGCNACVIACQSENNIPIVGKFEVARGREMHWIRLDRYYSSDDSSSNINGIPEDVQVSFQAMACAQCETAPCEQVCPVNATVHDDEGLNVMAYNRCVGTRYCANNCPYKVRRFNFFDWNKRAIDNYNEGPLGDDQRGQLPAMQKNPDVTIRMRGVMEKCTYCMQRIQESKINHKNKHGSKGDVKVPDGTIKTACQQVCPADAIIFGDISDPNSEVSKAKEIDRDYSVLGYLNTRPRTTYLAKIRNPNLHMPNAYAQPFSRKEYETRYGHGEGHHGDHGDSHHGSESSHGHNGHDHHDDHAHSNDHSNHH